MCERIAAHFNISQFLRMAAHLLFLLISGHLAALLRILTFLNFSDGRAHYKMYFAYLRNKFSMNNKILIEKTEFQKFQFFQTSNTSKL